MVYLDHRISIHAYSIEQHWWQSDVPKNEADDDDAKIMLALKQGVSHSFSKIIDMPVNGCPSLFRIDRAHQMDTSLSHA
jgi:hypothetical protein